MTLNRSPIKLLRYGIEPLTSKADGESKSSSLSHLKARALSFNSEEKAQVDRFVSGLEESVGASGKLSQ